MFDVVKGWKLPVVPMGYDCLVACHSERGFELDFVNESTGVFASEERKVDVAWPWRNGFKPTQKDWRRIGVSVIDFR